MMMLTRQQMWVTTTNLAADPRLLNTACGIVQSYPGAVNMSSGLVYKTEQRASHSTNILHGRPALFIYVVSRRGSILVFIHSLDEESVMFVGQHPENTHCFRVVLVCKVELMGLLSFRQEVHLSKDRPHRSTSLPPEFGNVSFAL